MTDHDEPRPEIEQFLSDRAGALDRASASIDAEEATRRTVTHSLEPARRWIHTPAAVADHARRRPAVAAAVIAALLIGSVGGFAAGRSSAPGRSSVAAAHGSQDKNTDALSSGGFAYATGGGMYPGGPVLTLAFLRTTSEGVGLRGYLQQMDYGGMNIQPVCDPSQWCPPPDCNPTTFFMAELSSAEAVAQNGSPVFPLDAPAASRGEIPFGQMEGAPTSAYMVQTNSDVTTVRGTWPDGFVDEMAPENGWAIVAHTGATQVSALVALLADGSSLSLTNSQGSYMYPAKCSPPLPPPPELPPAGQEQPADQAGATTAVQTAYNTVWDHTTEPTSRSQYIEDQPSIQSAIDASKKNFPQAADTITVEVGEIRFLSTTEAALFFELKYDGGQLFGKQIGYAKLVDGTWKVSRDTMCMVLGWAGGQCDPPPDPARSTSAGNAPQPGTYSGPSSASSASSSSAPTTAN
ncbi:MAG: hypothetical protein QOD92_1622 [Acidimicrobiaceae bacterium]